MSRRARLVLAPLAGAAAGIVVGASVMGLVVLLVRVFPRDSWADLGLVVVGILLAVAAGVAVWVGGLLWAARRLFDAGRRLGVVIPAVAAVFVLLLAVAALASALDDVAGLPRVVSVSLAWLGVLVVLTTPSVVFVLRDRSGGEPRY